MKYKGFTIEPETESWEIKYGYNYRYYRGDVMDETTKTAKSIEEAKEEIDEMLIEEESWEAQGYKSYRFFDSLTGNILYKLSIHNGVDHHEKLTRKADELSREKNIPFKRINWDSDPKVLK